jgi:hypothetical protein
VREFEQNAHRFSARDCRANAERFSTAQFRERFLWFIERVMPGAAMLALGSGSDEDDGNDDSAAAPAGQPLPGAGGAKPGAGAGAGVSAAGKPVAGMPADVSNPIKVLTRGHTH